MISPAASAMWEQDRASRSLGMELVAAEDGHAVLTMTVRQEMVNGLGVCHGGFIFTLADSAMAFASNGAAMGAVAGSAAIEFLAPAELGDLLTATATTVPLGASRRTAFHDVAVRNQEESVIAILRGRTVRR
jgi:acyl-CoA thioesterase